ncbi:MAG: DUF6499 domain-containing protein [Sideroxydans sp.]|nr:DUF6499 domain-containing protein [Sideroxydans sp.]
MSKSKIAVDGKNGSRKQKKFHDGKNEKDYKKCKSWSYRRWAWEFLCRNPEFQKASDRAVNGTDEEKAAVAKQFGLTKFKYYADVQTKKDGYPTFKEGAIKSWINLGPEVMRENIGIYPGQVVIRFKLTSALNAKQAVDAQINKARTVLQKNLAEFQKLLNKKIGRKNPKANLFPRYLRILDMQAQGMEPKEITACLNKLPPGADEENLDSLVRETYKHKATAEECMKLLYRYIALRPNKKKR